MAEDESFRANTITDSFHPGARKSWVLILVLALPGCVPLGQSLYLSVPLCKVEIVIIPVAMARSFV